MIDAIAQVNSVQAPELRLAGSLAPALRARLNGMPGMQRTRHLGWLDQAQLAEEMAQAHAGLVLLHPTNHYLVIRPNKLFDYMATGLPVNASDFVPWRGGVDPAGCGHPVHPPKP